MTYIVMDPCIKCKFMDCVEVCPVDCFYEGENFLAINPDECIDCGVCEPECPVDAIKPDTEDDPDGKWLRVNSEYSRVWPNITVKGEPPGQALPPGEGRRQPGVRGRRPADRRAGRGAGRTPRPAYRGARPLFQLAEFLRRRGALAPLTLRPPAVTNRRA